MKYLLPLLTLFITPSLSYAVYGERWYNVEVIIFAYTSDTGVQEEHWPIETGQPDIINSVSLISHSNEEERLPGQIIEFEELPFEMLSGALKRMQRSSRYDVIYSRAWRLPDLPKHSAPPVRIRAGKRYTTDGTLAPMPISDTSGGLDGNPAQQPIQETSATLDGFVDDALYEIDGRIKISLSKYLDVDTDLLYRRPVTLPDSNGLPVNEFRQFRLNEFRRMKSKTIHYLDHPLFGVIVGIDRYVPEETFDVIQPKSAIQINQ
jgi:hypothetical protein